MSLGKYLSITRTDIALIVATVIPRGEAYPVVKTQQRSSYLNINLNIVWCSMLLVDDQGGSKGKRGTILELLNPLIEAGLPAVSAHLHSADFAFTSKDGQDIGIELKRLDGGSTDLTQSLMSGRLSGHQLPKMLGPKGSYDRAWLVIEGQWRHDDNGQVCVYRGPRKGWAPIKGRMSASELEKRILTLELCGGLHVRYTTTRRDTIRFIASLYRWFVDKSVSSHTSHLAQRDIPTLTPVSDYRAFYMKIPGVGYSLSRAVENYFKGGPRQAWCASVAEWAEITTGDKKIGNKIASQIVSFCRGGI